MKLLREVTTFKAYYGRIGIVNIVESECLICKKEKICIYIDGSEDEYGSACICADCVKLECEK